MEQNRPITMDDLPAGCRTLAAFLGLERFLEVAEVFGGEMIYIPNLNHVRARMRNRGIRAEYQSETEDIPHLSLKYRLSERQIRNIVRGRK